jgi:hypothetical protein
MKIKLQIKSIYGSVLFEFEKENNKNLDFIKPYLRKIKLNRILSKINN